MLPSKRWFGLPSDVCLSGAWHPEHLSPLVTRETFDKSAAICFVDSNQIVLLKRLVSVGNKTGNQSLHCAYSGVPA